MHRERAVPDFIHRVPLIERPLMALSSQSRMLGQLLAVQTR